MHEVVSTREAAQMLSCTDMEDGGTIAARIILRAAGVRPAGRVGQAFVWQHQDVEAVVRALEDLRTRRGVAESDLVMSGLQTEAECRAKNAKNWQRVLKQRR